MRDMPTWLFMLCLLPFCWMIWSGLRQGPQYINDTAKDWATVNHFLLLKVTYPKFNNGNGKYHTVIHVKVLDESTHTIRQGYLRWDNRLFGGKVDPSTITVQWEGAA